MTEYVLFVDAAVELQNSFHVVSARSGFPMKSPNSSILLSKPAPGILFVVISNVATVNFKSNQLTYETFSLNITIRLVGTRPVLSSIKTS